MSAYLFSFVSEVPWALPTKRWVGVGEHTLLLCTVQYNLNTTNEEMDGSGAHTLLFCTVQYNSHSSQQAQFSKKTIHNISRKKVYLKLMPLHNKCSLPRKLCTKHMTKRKLILMSCIWTKSKERNNREARHSEYQPADWRCRMSHPCRRQQVTLWLAGS